MNMPEYEFMIIDKVNMHDATHRARSLHNLMSTYRGTDIF